MFNPDKNDYPKNAAGQPEFASIILTIDQVTSNAPGDDVVQKLVLSTQDVIASLAAIAGYFGQPTLLGTPTNGRLLVESGRQENPVFVYTTPREGTTQVITSTPTWDMLLQHPDFGGSSALVTSEKLQEIIAAVQGQLLEQTGGFSELILLDLSVEKFSSSPASEQTGTSEDGEGSAPIAESLRDTAAVESIRMGDDSSGNGSAVGDEAPGESD